MNFTIARCDFAHNENFKKMIDLEVGDRFVFHLTVDVSIEEGWRFRLKNNENTDFVESEVVGVFTNMLDKRKHSLELEKLGEGIEKNNPIVNGEEYKTIFIKTK